MKLNKFTSALIALGVVSLAGAAQASTTVIYLTGSTAARGVIDSAMTTSGVVFTGAGTIVKGSASSGLVVYEGNIAGVGTVDIDCSWTGSEAGIAAVAGQGLNQTIGGTSYPLPGVPPSFLDPTTTPPYSATNALASISGAPANPDLCMADSSQAVSRTPSSLYPLTDYGIVGIVPFTFLKGYNSAPDNSWNHLKNVSTGNVNGNLAAGTLFTAYSYTGVLTDTDPVAIVGRNFGSGTRVNTFLNMQYGLTVPVKQYAFGTSYPSGTPGVLTFGGSYASGQSLFACGNDGFDSGSGVQKVLNVDGSGSGKVLIGYVGIGDGQNAVNPAKAGAGQVATALTYNGVYESDSGVITGTYPFWGQEHLLGSIGQSGNPATVAAAIKAGIATELSNLNYGNATGDFSTLGTASPAVGALGQSPLIPVSLMQVNRSADSGFPSQGGF